MIINNGPVYVLGISGNNGEASGGDAHHPASALLRDGEIVAMAGEERFNRVKHSIGYFPYQSARFCLNEAGIDLEDVSAIAWSNDPNLALKRWIEVSHTTVKRTAYAMVRALKRLGRGFDRGLGFVDRSLKPWEEIEGERNGFRIRFDANIDSIPFFCIDHHRAHAASAYYASGFDEATIITWDGSGDGLSATISRGRNGVIETLEERNDFSIGDVYWAIHKFLQLSDEGSLMGLAGYGKPNGTFDKYIDPPNLWMDFDKITRPPIGHGMGYSRALTEWLGRPRKEDGPISDYHKTIAADLQKLVEDFGFSYLKHALKLNGCRNVAFAGGVALNATMNGKIARSGLVDRIFIQPEAGDAGGALGAAYEAYIGLGHNLKPAELPHTYWGIGYSDDEIQEALDIVKVKCTRHSSDELIDRVATMLSQQKIIGWFQGRGEWGPRALGARSILGDPRDREMLYKVNSAVKYRDGWRPFAPSILEEVASDYLDGVVYSPFMIMTFPVREDKKSVIPAVVHVDGTTRPQMVRRAVNPLYYDMIKRFGEITGVPIVMNTSFNLKGEPVVNSPRDAIRTFYSSGLDALAIGSFILEK
ncbi:MAG: carbamoyltransferase [Pyrinomonadaceae bacterium]